MAAAVPTAIPAQVRAGETLLFEITLADYAANDSPAWVLYYYFRPKENPAVNFNSTASGAAHRINVAFATTALWKEGVCDGIAVVTDGTTKKEVWSGRLEVLPNLIAADGSYDARSQARRTLDNINAVLEGRAGSSILNSTVEGSTLNRIPHDQLLLLKDRYEVIVANEETKASGRTRKRNVYVGFTPPR